MSVVIESMQRAQQPGCADASFLVKALSAVASELQVPVIYLALVQAAAQLMGADSAAFYKSEGGEARAVAMLDGGRAVQPGMPAPAIAASERVFQEAQATEAPALIADLSGGGRWTVGLQGQPGAEPPATVYMAPLRVGDRLLGLLELDYTTAVSLDAADTEILQQFIDVAARQMLHALLLEEQREQAHCAEVRIAISAALGDLQDRSAVLQGLADELGQALGVSRCVVHAGGRARRTRHIYEAEPCATGRQMDAALVTIEAAAAERAITLVAPDLRLSEGLDPILVARREALLAAQVRALIVTPLVAGDETLGTLILLDADGARSWRPAEVVLVEQVARDAAVTLRRVQREAEEERHAESLRRERDLLRAAIDQLPLGVVIAETPHDLILWNRGAQHLLAGGGAHALQDAEPPMFDTVTADGRPVAPDDRPLARAFRDEAAIAAQEISVRQRDGRLVPATVSATPLYDAQGALAGMLETTQDLTALRQAEARAGTYQAWFQASQGVARALTTLPIEEAGRAVAELLAAVVPFELVTLLIAGAEDGAPSERLVQWSPRQSLALDPAIDGVMVQRLRDDGDTLVIDDLGSDEDAEGLGAAVGAGARSCIAVPIRSEQEVLGAIVLYSAQAGCYRDSERAPLMAIAAMLALALRTDQQVRQAREVAIRDERERLAREIHDTLAQSITGVVMQLDSVMLATPVDAPHRSRLEQARQMAREGLTQTRRSVWNLKPVSAKQSVPRIILQDEIAVLEQRMGIQPDVTTTGEEREVAPEVGAVLQRLIRVSLENTWMHSEAKQVRIVLDYGLQSLTVLIEDDGQGFDPDTVKLRGEGRAGLAGVAERARLIGGIVRIKSAVGHGTQVQAELPYLPAEPAPVVVPPIPAPAVEATPPAGTAKAPGSDSIKVFLIDDHAMVREGLERMLQDQDDLQVIGAAATGTEGLRRIAELHPDVVLCDLQLPDMSGVDVISRIHTHFRDIRCVVVTTYADEDSIHEGFKAGAKGYVLKDVSATELANAVRAAARDESLLQPIVARKLVEGFTELARQGGMVEALTEREVEVLKALASGARNKEIAFDLGLSESTIKTHLASIFGKLNVTTRTEAVAKGRDLGLISL